MERGTTLAVVTEKLVAKETASDGNIEKPLKKGALLWVSAVDDESGRVDFDVDNKRYWTFKRILEEHTKEV